MVRVRFFIGVVVRPTLKLVDFSIEPLVLSSTARRSLPLRNAMSTAVRSATLVNTPRRSRLSFSSLNQRSIRLSHELEVGVKYKCQRRRVLVRQPLLHLGRGVGIPGRRWCPFARPEVPVRA